MQLLMRLDIRKCRFKGRIVRVSIRVSMCIRVMVSVRLNRIFEQTFPMVEWPSRTVLDLHARGVGFKS